MTKHRAPLRLAVAALLGVQTILPLHAQQPVMVEGPVMQVGPDGAVDLDQSMMMGAPQYNGMPYYAGQPVTMPAQPYPQPYAQPFAQSNAQPYVQPFGQPGQFGQPYAQPYSGQPWGQQAVQPQSTWGTPLLQMPNLEGLTAGPIPPVYIHRTAVFGEFLYMRPRDAEVAYALPIDGPVAPVLGNEVPVGPVAVVDPDYDIAFRAGINYAINCGASLRGQYTRFRGDVNNAVTVDAPTVLRSLVSHPLGANAATDSLDASAALDTQLDQIDLDFRSLWLGCECPSCAYAVSWLVGANFVRLDQNFAASYATEGVTTVSTDVKFQGFGMRFGLEGERIFPARGLFVYGSGITSFLFGEFDTNYSQVSSFNGVEALTSWNAGRIVPMLEFEAGAGWLGVNRHLRLSAGYRVSTWFNFVQTDEWIRAVQYHDFTNMDGTLTFDGLVGRAEWLF